MSKITKEQFNDYKESRSECDNPNVFCRLCAEESGVSNTTAKRFERCSTWAQYKALAKKDSKPKEASGYTMGLGWTASNAESEILRFINGFEQEDKKEEQFFKNIESMRLALQFIEKSIAEIAYSGVRGEFKIKEERTYHLFGWWQALTVFGLGTILGLWL